MKREKMINNNEGVRKKTEVRKQSKNMKWCVGDGQVGGSWTVW